MTLEKKAFGPGAGWGKLPGAKADDAVALYKTKLRNS